MEENAISVSQISHYIKSIFLAEEMLINVSVYGEVSGLNFSRDVAYFNLKDENALLSCVCFEKDKFEHIKEGDKVVVKGSPNYYIKGGRLSFNVSNVKPYGVGDLYQKFMELKKQLEKEGLFDSSIKKKMPKSIKRIGVVTSSTGAVIQDIINIRNRRDPSIDIVISDCKVQGQNADKEICDAIRLLDCCSNVDLIIVARGGGSFEDLNCFNSKELAYTIYNTKKFVLSAVGHETDFTICDFVADMRAPTPSAAAELVTQDIVDKKRILKIFADKLYREFSIVERNKNRVFDLRGLLLNKYKLYFDGLNNKVKEKLSILSTQITQITNEEFYKFGLLENRFKARDPMFFKKMGFVKIEKNGKVLKSVKELMLNDEFEVSLVDGKIVAEVKSIKDK